MSTDNVKEFKPRDREGDPVQVQEGAAAEPQMETTAESWWRRWFLREVGDGESIPRGYGLAYQSKGRAVCVPLGLNVIVGLVRRSWVALIIGFRPTFVELLIERERRRADAGGYDRAIQDTQRQLEMHFGERVRQRLADAPLTAEALGDAAAAETDEEEWSQEERVFFNASIELAKRKGDAIFFACQDPRCQGQPILSRVEGNGGFWLACMHKRRWVPDPVGKHEARVSRRALARMGLH